MSQRTPQKAQPIKPKVAEAVPKQFKPTAEDEERYRALFNSEEQEAEQRDRLADVAQSKQLCSELNALFDDIAALKSSETQNPKVAEALNEKRIDVLMKVVSLKKLNRLTQTRLRRVRERTTEARIHVDTRNAQLENSQYELVQLNTEIRKCLDFASRDDRIDLVSEEELIEALGRGGRTAEADSLRSADAHSRNVARLNYELTERTRLEEAATRLRNECDAVRVELERRETYLDSVLPLCRKLAEEVRPLERALGLRESDSIEQHSLASYLPDALYTVYLHLEALAQADDESQSTAGELLDSDYPDVKTSRKTKCAPQKRVTVELDGDLETTRAWYDCGYLEKIEEETDADWLAAVRLRETDDDAESTGQRATAKATAKKRHTRAHAPTGTKKRKGTNGQSGSSTDSDGDEDDGGSKQQPVTAPKRAKPGAIANARLFVAHPIAIVLKLTVFDDESPAGAASSEQVASYTFALRIEYLIRLKLATCKLINANEVCDSIIRRLGEERGANQVQNNVRAIVARVLDADGVLANLLTLARDGDAFATTRFNALQFERSVDVAARCGFASREVRAQFGIPFSWLQVACGMHLLYERSQEHPSVSAPSKSNSNTTRSKRASQPSTTEPRASVEQLVEAIRARFAYRVRMARQLFAIASGSCMSTCTEMWSVTSFEPVTFADLRSSPVAGRLVRALLSSNAAESGNDADGDADAALEDGLDDAAESTGLDDADRCVSRFDFCFRLSASRNEKLANANANVRLNTYLLVPHRDRSASRPLLIVSIEFVVDECVTQLRSAANDTRLFEIERKLNVTEAESAGTNGQFDLLTRVQHLFEYIEVYLHVGGAAAPHAGEYQHLRAGKGPSRTPPLCKIEQLNLFVHDEHA